MKRISILFSLLFVMAIAMHGQGTFHDAVMDYIKACPSSTVSVNSSMKNALQMVNKELMKNYDEQRSDALVQKYLDGPFLDNMTDNLLVPMFQKHATIEDLQYLTMKYRTNAGQVFQTHQAKMNTEGIGLVQQKCGDAIKQILAGQPPQKEQPRNDIPQAYQKLYYQFYDASKLDDAIDPILTTLSQNVGAGKEDIVAEFKNYVSANMKTIYLNMSYDYMTTDDLNFGLTVFGSDAHQHSMAALNEMPKMAQTGGMALIMAYLDWLKEQGVELNM